MTTEALEALTDKLRDKGRTAIWHTGKSGNRTDIHKNSQQSSQWAHRETRKQDNQYKEHSGTRIAKREIHVEQLGNGKIF